MAKKLCPLCNKGKARRACSRENDAMICSVCCAEQRSVECDDCLHYSEAEKYAFEQFKHSGKHPFILDMSYEDELDEICQLFEKNLKEAEKRLEKFADLIPDSHLYHFAQGVADGMNEKYQQALLHFERSIEIFPYFTQAWFNKGMALLSLYDLPGYIKAMMMVKHLTNPDDGLFREADKRLKETDKDLQKTSQQTLDEFLQAEKLYSLAFKQMEQGEHDVAIKNFLRVLKGQPDHVQSHGNLGLCYAMTGRNEKAVSELKKALALDPDYLPARHNLAAVCTLEEGEKLSLEQFPEPIEFYKYEFLRRKTQKEKY